MIRITTAAMNIYFFLLYHGLSGRAAAVSVPASPESPLLPRPPPTAAALSSCSLVYGAYPGPWTGESSLSSLPTTCRPLRGSSFTRVLVGTGRLWGSNGCGTGIFCPSWFGRGIYSGNVDGTTSGADEYRSVACDGELGWYVVVVPPKDETWSSSVGLLP